MKIIYNRGGCEFITGDHLFLECNFVLVENNCHYKCRMGILTRSTDISEHEISIRLINYATFNLTSRDKCLDYIYNRKLEILDELKQYLRDVILDEIEQERNHWIDYRLELLFW
ncbi:hypothetical protein [Psychrobacillus sp. FSL H8-0487]|uniref:hypothetical protein n=1 Tax=Psychrobacillus sp. FSL H8-0487 TaxID=2921391 RepID=UPI0030F747F3